MSSASPAHRWKFIRAGGVDQVEIRNGGDIIHLDQLDQKLWAALACPTRGLELDARTLDLIDSDGDGRIRAPEILAVSRWVAEHVAQPDCLIDGGDSVPLDAIHSGTDSGRRLAAEARELLALVGRPEATAISLADIAARSERLAAMGLNGDGVVPVAAAGGDTAAAALIQRVIDTVGSVSDRNGKPGINQDLVDAFFAQAQALDSWRRQAEGDAALQPLGADSRAAGEALAAVRLKIDDHFARCALAAYDASAMAPLNPTADGYKAMADGLLAAQSAAIEALPLATVAPGRALPLRHADTTDQAAGSGVNPAWAQRIDAFRRLAAEPLLQRPPGSLDSLSAADWSTIQTRLAPCTDWLAKRPDTALDSLPDAALQDLLTGDARQQLAALIQHDATLSPSNLRIDELERLVRYQRDLVLLLNNFVSFSNFYGRQGGIFEAGTLYLDARSCDLAVAVPDVAKHALLATRSKAYLAYCECRRNNEKMHIAAAFTAGDVDDLFVGRNGVFYDRQGRDWDATITKVIENPISIRQAFFLPYKKLLRLIEAQVAKRAAAGDKASDDLLGSAANRVTTAPAAKPGAAPAAAATKDAGASRIDVGTVAALGVGLGSISAVLVGVFSKFVDLGWWIPVALLVIMLAISGPSMVIAALKLRLRSLGPMLDASGWAVNGRLRINVPLGGMLTQRATLPAGAERRLRDPYSDSRAGRLLIVLALVALAAALYAGWAGWLGGWLPWG